MEALWVCVYEQLERSNWNDPELLSPSGLPGHTVKGQKAEEWWIPQPVGRRVAPRSCARRVPSRDETLLASEGKLEWKENLCKAASFPCEEIPRDGLCAIPYVPGRVDTDLSPSSLFNEVGKKGKLTIDGNVRWRARGVFSLSSSG